MTKSVSQNTNKKALEGPIGNKLPFDYALQGPLSRTNELNAIKAVWDGKNWDEILSELGITTGKIPGRMSELKLLYDAGYKYTLDDVYNSIILIKP